MQRVIILYICILSIILKYFSKRTLPNARNQNIGRYAVTTVRLKSFTVFRSYS